MARLTRGSRTAREYLLPRAEPVSGWGANPLHACRRVSFGALALYVEQLSELLNAGVSVHEAMLQLAGRTPDARLRRMSQEIAPRAAAGEALGRQLQRYPQLIPPYVSGMVLAAERAGTLPAALAELAEDLLIQHRVQRQAAWAAVWVGLVLAVASTIVPMAKAAMLAAAQRGGGDGPDETTLDQLLRVALPAMRDWLVRPLLPCLLGGGAGLLAARVVAGLPGLAGPIQRLMRRVPIVGGLVRVAATVRFLVSLHALLRAGVQIQEAVGTAGQATGDAVMTDQLGAASSRIRGGQSLARAIHPCSCLSRDIRDSLAQVERAGTYDHTLTTLIAASRETRRRTVASSGILGYGFILLTGAALVALCVYSFFAAYTRVALQAGHE